MYICCMGRMKKVFEDYHQEEMMKEYYNKLYTEEKMFFEKNGDDVELIDMKKCEDPGMGDDQHRNLSRKR